MGRRGGEMAEVGGRAEFVIVPFGGLFDFRLSDTNAEVIDCMPAVDPTGPRGWPTLLHRVIDFSRSGTR